MLSVILPTRNEEKSIAKVIEEVYKSCFGTPFEIIVVDTSTDNTEKVALEAGATKVARELRRGKGFAVETGVILARGDVIAIIDGDGTYSLRGLPQDYQAIASCTTDAIFGKRVLTKGSMSILHRLGNWGLSLLASGLYGKGFADVCTGYKVFNSAYLQGFRSRGGFIVEAELLDRLSKLGGRLSESKVEYRPRIGKSNLVMWDGVKIAWALITLRFA